MSNFSSIPPQFHEPPNWRWHSFTRETPKGPRTIRFGTSSPKDTIPDAIVVCLHGVREFSEKYFETARWCLDHNLAFWTFDWAGQGKSTRFIPHKRHSHGFREDIADLHYFILEYIKHASVHPDVGRIPMVMLAHSMGANLGLRYIEKHPDIFTCAGFTSPMISIKVFENIPPVLALTATSCASLFFNKFYVFGGHNWSNEPEPAHKTLTADPIRSKIHNQWGMFDPALVCGDVTYGWLHEAQKSCLALKPVNTPCLFGLADHEHLVDNICAKNFISRLPSAKIVKFPESHHEILMETDNIRATFLNDFYTLIKENVIDRPETLKPF